MRYILRKFHCKADLMYSMSSFSPSYLFSVTVLRRMTPGRIYNYVCVNWLKWPGNNSQINNGKIWQWWERLVLQIWYSAILRCEQWTPRITTRDDKFSITTTIRSAQAVYKWAPIGAWRYKIRDMYLYRRSRLKIDLLHKINNAPVSYPAMHHFITEICTCVHISVTKWCIVGYPYHALWDLGDGSIAPNKPCRNQVTFTLIRVPDAFLVRVPFTWFDW